MNICTCFHGGQHMRVTILFPKWTILPVRFIFKRKLVELDILNFLLSFETYPILFDKLLGTILHWIWFKISMNFWVIIIQTCVGTFWCCEIPKCLTSSIVFLAVFISTFADALFLQWTVFLQGLLLWIVVVRVSSWWIIT